MVEGRVVCAVASWEHWLTGSCVPYSEIQNVRPLLTHAYVHLTLNDVLTSTDPPGISKMANLLNLLKAACQVI